MVCSAVDSKSGNKPVAIKKVGQAVGFHPFLTLSSILQVTNAFDDLVDAKRIVREIKLLKFFNHENIIGLHDLLIPDDRTGFEDIYIVTDLMETDLHRVIYSRQVK